MRPSHCAHCGASGISLDCQISMSLCSLSGAGVPIAPSHDARAGPSGGVSTTAIRRGRHGFAPPPLYRLPRNNVEAFSRSHRRSDIAMICPRPHFFLRLLHGQRGSAGRQRRRGWRQGWRGVFLFLQRRRQSTSRGVWKRRSGRFVPRSPRATIGSLSGDGFVSGRSI